MNDSISPPFIPECEVIFEGGPNSVELFKQCKKNPGHPKFIPVHEFTKEHLPQGYQTEECMNYVQHLCDATVKITMQYTSPHRPDTYRGTNKPYPYSELKGSTRAVRCGTGFIVVDYIACPCEGVCPCHICKETDNPKTKYWIMTVDTATHVIFDKLEAAKSVFECFYDSADKKGVKYLYGTDMYINGFDEYMSSTDRCRVSCATHDYELVKKLRKYGSESSFNHVKPHLYNFIVSHPHGCSKHITVGTTIDCCLDEHDKINESIPHRFGKGVKCRLPLHYFSNKNFKNKSFLTKIKIFRKQLDPDLSITPGVIYSVPSGLTFTISGDAQYIIKSKELTFPFETPQKKFWLTLPPKTEFTMLSGKVFRLPAETEFYVSNAYYESFHSCQRYYTYNADTCPGSSGALVIWHPLLKHIDPGSTTHSGALKNGTNRSSVIDYILF